MTADKDSKIQYTVSPNAIDITPNKDGGVLKEIIKEGEGTDCPSIGCNIYVHYCGKLADGTVFDSTEKDGTLFNFVLGREMVIKAWDLGVTTMKKGEEALFICKPEYAYGAPGKPPKIPPDSTLIFEIQLVDWEAEDLSSKKDKGILRTCIRSGKGYEKPVKGSSVDVYLTGKYNGRVFDDRSVSFTLGDGEDNGIIEGIEKALLHFKEDEKSSLEIKPEYAFKSEGHKDFEIPPNATVTYEVELKNFEKNFDSWEMSDTEKVSQAEISKKKGSDFFKKEKYELALLSYTKVVDLLSQMDALPSEENEEDIKSKKLNLLLAARLNLAITYLKLNRNKLAKVECDEALKLDPNNVKAYFRRGQAYLNISEPELAKSDFEAVLELEPTNKLASQNIHLCCKFIGRNRELEKKFCSNMLKKYIGTSC